MSLVLKYRYYISFGPREKQQLHRDHTDTEKLKCAVSSALSEKLLQCIWLL